MSLSYSTIRNRLDQIARRKHDPADEPACPPRVPPAEKPCRVLDLLPGARLVRGTTGRTLMLERFYAPAGEALPLADEAKSSPVPLSALGHFAEGLAEAGPSLSPGEIGFLDTETTGLMGGTGTLAFLVGVGWWESGAQGWHFRVEQYLVDDFCHEQDMMERLAERLGQFSALCTYNGKSFDIPLLRARGILCRIPPRAFRHHQVDLLHFSRRLWGQVLPSVSLKNVEAEILGIDRGPDIDGAEIPEVFFEMAREGTAEHIPTVVEHNAQDIATLASLLSVLGRVTENPLGCGLLTRWEEFAAVARWQESRRQWEAAATAWGRAAALAQERETREDLLARLALNHKRRRAWGEAVALWEQLSRAPLRRSLEARIELAKYYEHVARDLPRSLEVVQRAQKALELEAEMVSYLRGETTLDGPLGAFQFDLEKRERRLRRRLNATYASS